MVSFESIDVALNSVAILKVGIIPHIKKTGNSVTILTTVTFISTAEIAVLASLPK